jgi:hypothetical protein
MAAMPIAICRYEYVEVMGAVGLLDPVSCVALRLLWFQNNFSLGVFD